MVIQRRARYPAPGLGVLALAVLAFFPGCAYFRGRPDTLPPAPTLYEDGERELGKGRYDAARDALRKIVERHPDSPLVPQARFLIGESYYREREWDKAVQEFDGFLKLYPGHAIADFAQYRLARSYFDGMPSLERDQGGGAKALAEFQKLLRRYPESRYAPDAIAKIEACRLRLAQKELWVADYYVRQGKLEAALQRYDAVLKDYARTPVIPQALFQKAEILARLDRGGEAAALARRLVEQYPRSEWARRACDRFATIGSLAPCTT